MRPALRLLAGHPARLAAAALLAAGMVLAGVGLLATSGYLVGRAALHPDTVLALMVAVTGVRFFGLARAGLRYAERLVSHDLMLRLLATLRRHLYARLVPLAPLGLTGRRSADLVGRLIADVDELQTLYLKLAAPLLAAALVAAVAVTLVAVVSAAAAWLTLALLLLAGVALPALLAAIGGPLGAREVALRGERRMLVLDSLQGAQELWVYGRQADYRARLTELERRLQLLANARATVEGLRDGSATLLALVAPWAALLVVLPAVEAGALAPLALLPLTLGASAAFEATVPLAEAFERWGRARAAATRITDVLAQEPAVVDPPRPAPLPADTFLRVAGVTFGYGRDSALNDVDLELAPGRRVALVGPSGSGKSTLLNLLVRFAEPQLGTVTLAGADLRSLAQDEVRTRLAVVPQQVRLFPTTVRANLAMARPGAPDEALWQALRQAELVDVVAALPAGLDTVLGEYGNGLSDGERQRLAIARALLKGAPLLLLDEPTAHLDALTERRVLRALLRPRADRGVLVATHRLVGLDDVDEILVLDAGRVVQRGCHHTLAGSRGLYRRMLQAQQGELIEDVTPPLAAPLGPRGT